MAVQIQKLTKNGVTFYPQTIADAVYVPSDSKSLDKVINDLKARDIIVDTALSISSTNAVQNKAVTTELNKKLDATDFNAKIGVANGVCPLGADTKVSAAYLPSYVDDVVELYRMGEGFDGNNTTVINQAGKSYNPTSKKVEVWEMTVHDNFQKVSEADPEKDKIYVNTYTNVIYRWSGSDMREISASLAIGETSSTAFAGSRGVALEQLVPNLEGNLMDLSAHVDDLENRTIDLEDSLNVVRDEVLVNTNSISSLQSSLNVEKGKISTLQGQMNAANQNISSNTQSITSLNTSLGTTNQNVTAVTGRVATIEDAYISSSVVGSKTYAEIPAGAYT